jgi:Arc/MetJ-type ribon-helix-helix transcriptional regulator
MRRRLSVRLTDDLARGIDAQALRHGTSKSEVVREALTSAGLATSIDTPDMAELLRRATAFRARQSEVVDAAALIRAARRHSTLRLELRRLTIPFMQGDLT